VIRQLQLQLTPSEAVSADALKLAVARQTGAKANEIEYVRILRRSYDARSRNIKVLLTVDAYINEPYLPPAPLHTAYKPLQKDKSAIIVGAGPAGLFAALRLLEHGVKPIVLERGKNIRERRRDLAAINKDHVVNPHSNYCFGEGGAGTYSDGKLYTRSNKRGDIKRVLEIFVEHGADENILVEAHPHIGTNKLPKIIAAMRDAVIHQGGEIHYGTHVHDFLINGNALRGVVTKKIDNEGNAIGQDQTFEANAVILATGHSARDVYRLLHRRNIPVEAKPFAVGVRAEHPQPLVDCIQYHCDVNEHQNVRRYLPAASYSLVHQAVAGGSQHGVYSFCMCPGGIIAPCATEQEQVVTNGWSPSKRNNPYANSGIVVEVKPEDLKPYREHGPLAGLALQQFMEHAAWEAGGKTQTAPAQRIGDFIAGKISSSLPECSYQPGIASAPLHTLLPPFVSNSLREGFKAFGRTMKGYLTLDAVIVGVETRTSSPVRIPRDASTLQHPQLAGLYPSAEGAGYAGGIVSAAMDGRKVADAIAGSIR
jgi:uncharacterized protein